MRPTGRIHGVAPPYSAPVSREALNAYLGGFDARCDAMSTAGQPAIAVAGLRGSLGRRDGSGALLLVSDDRAHERLTTLLPSLTAGWVTVLAAAPRCTDLLTRAPEWRANTATAMACWDLPAVPATHLPAGLRLRAVRRVADDGADGVALEDAVATAMASTMIDGPPDAFAAHLRAWPRSCRLLAAVDGHGVVRATSGFTVFGAHALIVFVNTLPADRGRGLARAMTGEALALARRAGATQAWLDSSRAARSVYQRLGFETISAVTRFALTPSG